MRRNLILTAGLFAGAVMIFPPAAAIAQVDMGCSPTLASPCSGDSSGGSSYSAPSYEPPAVYQPSPADLQQQQAVALQQQGLAQSRVGNFTEALRLFELSLKMCVDADDIQNLKWNIADTHSHLGTLAYKGGDVDQALREFELANEYRPGQAVTSESLTTVRNEVAARRQAAITQQQDKAAAANMQQAMQSFAQTLNAAPAAGGLDFDGGTSSPSPAAGTSGGLDFAPVVAAKTPTTPAPALPSGDPSLVEAPNVPSGLPKSVEIAIAGAYGKAPPGVSDRVRKGFQAAADRDWKVAKAWFEDALNRDPSNAGLKHLVELAVSAPARIGQVTAPAAEQMQMPAPDDWKLAFPGLQAAEDKEAMDLLFGLQPSK